MAPAIRLRVRDPVSPDVWCFPWRIDFPNAWRNFDFTDDVTYQLVKMAQACQEGKVLNSEDSWATDVLVEVMSS